MRGPLISSTGQFFPVWSGFADPTLRPVLLVARDGSGYQPVDMEDLGGTALLSGVNVTITGIIDNEQVTQIAGSGNISTANKVFVDSNGRLFALVAQSGTWSVGLTGTNNVTVTNPVSQIEITGQPLNVNAGQSGAWNVLSAQSGNWSTTTLNPQTKIGITGVTGLGVDSVLAGGYNSLATIVTSGTVTATISNPISQVGVTGQPINVNAGQSGSWNVSAAQSGSWSVTNLNPQTKVGITGVTGLGVDIVLAGGFNSIAVGITSGAVTATISNPTTQVGITGQPINVNAGQSGAWTVSLTGSNSITVSNPDTKVGITGVTGLGVDVVLAGGYNSLSVIVPSGTVNSAQQGAWNVLAKQSGEFTALVAQSGAWSVTQINPQTQIGITGQPLNVNAGQSGIWTVSLTGSNNITVSNPDTKVGITGVTGLGVDIVSAGGYNSLASIITSGTVSANQNGGWNVLARQSGEFTALVAQSGGWSVTQLNPQTKVGITGSNGSGIDSLLVGGYNSLTVAITSGASNTTKFGITGVTGLGTDVVLAGGYNSIPVIITSGLPSLASGILSSVGISGSTGLLATVTGAYGTNALCVAITSGNSFVRGSGTNRGHRITTSGVSQQVAASNANRRYLKVQNIDDTNLWVNYGSVASSGSGSFILFPGGSDVYEAGFIETGSVNLFGLVAGKQFTIKEA